MKIFTRTKFLLLLLFILVNIPNLFAQVSVTQATGGTGVSNDLSSIGPTPTYSPLTNIVITATTNADFTNGTNRTITFAAPAGWRFEVGQGLASAGGSGITIVSTGVTATTATVTYNASSVTSGSSITISGLRVQSTTKVLGSTVNMIRGGNGGINGFANGTIVTSLSKVVGAAVGLQVLLPGQSNVAGSATGKTGSVVNQTAGATFSVVVNAVDYAFNIVAAAPNQLVSLSSTNPNLSFSGNQVLSSGTTTFNNVSLNTAGGTTNYTITATDVTDGSLAQNTSSNIRAAAGAFSKLLVLFPGETLAPGSATGKTGPITAPAAGVNYTATVYAVDNHWNRVISTNNVGVSATGVTNANQPLANTLPNTVNGRVFTFVFRTIGEIPTITATNITANNTSFDYTQALPAVTVGPFARLQILLPGEVEAPGTATGKTVALPTPRTAGTPFTVRVRAVDAAWNVVSGVTDLIRLTTNDVNATMPSDMPMETDGEIEFTTVSLNTAITASTRTITASNFTDNSKTAQVSPGFAVAVGAFSKLQVILPGEVAAPGTATGKTAAVATDRSVGVAFNVTVNAVDANWNRILGNTASVAIATDNAGTTPPAANSLANGTRAFSVTLMSATPTIVTATSAGVTDGTSASVNVVGGVFTKLQILLPGETAAPGTPSGKTGAPTPRQAGTPFIVRVRAVDGAWNLVTGVTDLIRLTTNDVNATMPADIPMETDGEVEFASVTLNTAIATSTRTITASNFTDNSKTAQISPTFVVNVGAFSKLQVILPGEVAAPGTATGKTAAAATDRSVGVAFNVTVNAVDANWNRILGNTANVAITTDNAGTVPPAANNLANGTRAFSVTLMSATPTIITATSAGVTNGVSASVNVIGAVFTKLQILLPGENAAPGTPSGKTGAPTPRKAGTPFIVKVRAVDGAWNLVTGVTDVIRLTTNDVNATMPADLPMESDGEVEFTAVTLKTAIATNSRTITASNFTDNSKTAQISPTFSVTPGDYAKLQVILPGETAAPGTALGKTGTVTDRLSGTAFNVRVNSVDDNWNVVSTTHNISFASNDANATIPAAAALASGTRNFTGVTLRTLGAATITITNNTIASNLVSNLNVIIGPFVKLQLLMPGEVAAPGTLTGKTAALPTARTAGVPFNVTVNAVDAGWNIITSVTNEAVNFASATSDPYAQLPVGATLTNGVLTTSVTYRVGNATVNRRLTASHATATSSQSPLFGVNIGAYARLLILLPGETFVAGHPDGKTGPASNQGRGVQFTVAIRATDIAYNQITGPTDQIQVTSTDPIFTASPVAGPLSATTGQRTFNVTLGTESTTNTLTAAVTPASAILSSTTLVSILDPSNAADFFRSVVATGNWNNTSSWETSVNGISGWKPSTLIPNTTSSSVTIRNGNTINIITAVTIDDVAIDNGGQLNINNGGSLTIADKALTPIDFIVEGTLRNNARTITTTGVLQIANGGRYQHNFTTTSGTIPTATWSAGSTCEILGYTSFATSVVGSNQTFSNFIWNTPILTGSPMLSSGFATTNLTVSTTGNTGTLNFADAGGSLAIPGNYVQSAGTVRANKSSGTFNLSFGGDFAVNGGNFGLGNGTVNVTFNGASQNLNNAGTAIQFQNVTFSGGTKTLTSGNFAVGTTGVLTLGSATTLAAGGNLTIMSSTASSGTVASIPSSSAITGNVIVQRSITGGAQDPYRTYRMISSPIYDNGNAGNRRYSHAQFIDDILVTGTGGSANGFDDSPFNNASAWVYGPPFADVVDINTTLAVGKSAYIYYRGDKSNISGKLNSPYVDPETTIMDFVGELNQQDVAVTLNNGGNLVGNPYASSIDWNSSGILKPVGLSNTIRIWNPASRSYATHNGSVGVPDGIASSIIPASQGFFVQSTGAATLTFTEAAKLNTQVPVLLMSAPVSQELTINKFAATQTNNIQAAQASELRITLTPNGSVYKEETAVVFQAGKNGAYDVAEDANYVHNYSAQPGGQKVFLSSLSTNDRNLVINYMPEIANGSRVKLNVYDFNDAGNYQLKINYKDVPAGYTVKLNDNFSSTSTVVQPGDTYSFTIDKTKANSYGNNRFSVSFEAPTTLPVTYSSFNVAKVNEGVLVKWSTQTETNNNRFEVQRAGDDKAFVKLHTETAKGNSSSYSYIDKNPLLGNNYYRLLQVDNDNNSTPNEPQVINYTGEINAGKDVVSVFPNPVVSKFTVKYNGALTTNQQTLKIVSATGQVLLNKLVNKAELISGHEINISSYATGVYMIEIYEGGKQRIGQMKLIKQ